MPPRRRRPPRAGALSELPPLKILRSILLLQISYYAVAFILLIFTVLVFGQNFSVGLVFDWNNIKRDNTLGWLIAIVWLLVAFFTVIPLLLLVSRSKLVPDFALTIHFLHLLITSVYTRAIPTNLLWWGLQIASAALLVSLGVWACRYREMQPISFPSMPTPGKNNKKKTQVNGSAAGPSYEMVGQRDEESQT
ncbi:Integral membrane protein of the Golgi [Knufia obscura]|uniref:Integral membrane protein of the Golgi n=2 Tax=Knufia TaxID=430999 RepID=A0AAN8I791_9EURO|nr:Integral membrane protein of the Golgi [Knufia obscura]KAK5957887.1 Integral membrane protein of the Golgi [Knufia fluminis]